LIELLERKPWRRCKKGEGWNSNPWSCDTLQSSLEKRLVAGVSSLLSGGTAMENKSRASFVSLLLVLAVVEVALGGSTIYVDADAKGKNNGTTWTNAYKFLQDALVASSTANEIRVAQGVYKPDRGGGKTPGDRAASFVLCNGLTVKGGYAGFGAPDPDARDVEAYKTILSGDLNGNDVQVPNPLNLLTEPTRSDNAYHVVTGSGTNTTAVLDGFTITAGHATGWLGGGGMLNRQGSPTIASCLFEKNFAEASGGGMGNDDLCNPIIKDCTFRANVSLWAGGAVANGNSSNPHLSGCRFTANVARYDGGGICNAGSKLALTSCVFEKNSASRWGGGMANDNDGDPVLTRCTFRENSAWDGGGMFTFGKAALVECTFHANSADGTAGLASTRRNCTLVSCTFTANHSRGDAGGLGIGGNSLTAANCLFVANSATHRGGAVNDTAWDPTTAVATFVNCTFVDNCAESQFGGIGTDGCPNLSLLNCILWHNRDAYGLGSSSQIGTIGGSVNLTVSYCCIQGWGVSARGRDANWNINANPLFVRSPSDGGDGWGDNPATSLVNEGANDDFGDLHLRPESPCIDAGNNASVPLEAMRDLDGNLRIQGAAVDLGAYETNTSLEDTLRGVISQMQGLDRTAFTDPNSRDVLVNELQAVVALIGGELFGEALHELREEIIPRMDGCGTTGGPDDTDWITTCEAQQSLCPVVSAVAEVIEPLVVEPDTTVAPVAHWMFDDGTGATASDSAGRYHGSIYGAKWVDGYTGRALAFDGIDDYVDCGTDDALASERMTLAFWVFAEEPLWNRSVLGKAGNMSFSRDYAFTTDNEMKLEFSFGESAWKLAAVQSKGALPVGQWVHVVAMRDGATASLYLNGQLESSAAYLFPVTNKGQGLRFGSIGTTDGWAGFFKGRIDEVRIYDQALPVEDIQELYQQESP
jgi:hypothetical protein